MTIYKICWNIGEKEISTNYKPKSDHRDNTHGKSQWTISLPEEVKIFTLAMGNKWISDKWGWGIYTNAGQVAVLGVDKDHKTTLFLSRFDENAGEWHGYPVNYKEKQQKPPSIILLDWVDQNIITKVQMRRIVRSQPCRI
ncbi:hypothetical protein JK176_02570 [Gluconobacter sp. Dm-73]|uniref:hypothetical protein n=1 Tax=Gluconobacter sp. Dm-73 TaxID=2799802 RepID=UPI001B8AF19F|nr:hypothetical protein [Gluconobacter sp. Dm-73]MBS1073764.1 hypothetical protein [Gluconobacter sp. Dm-73]